MREFVVTELNKSQLEEISVDTIFLSYFVLNYIEKEFYFHLSVNILENLITENLRIGKLLDENVNFEFIFHDLKKNATALKRNWPRPNKNIIKRFIGIFQSEDSDIEYLSQLSVDVLVDEILIEYFLRVKSDSKQNFDCKQVKSFS